MKRKSSGGATMRAIGELFRQQLAALPIETMTRLKFRAGWVVQRRGSIRISRRSAAGRAMCHARRARGFLRRCLTWMCHS